MVFSAKKALVFAGAASAAALCGAFVAQYGFNLHPCELCLAQRYPYAAIIVLILAGVVAPLRFQRPMLLLCALLFLADAGIAFYHTGVEQGWFKAPDACSSSASPTDSLEALRAQIMNAPLVVCTQAAAYFFGLSMAAWNTMYALICAIITKIMWRKTRG